MIMFIIIVSSVVFVSLKPSALRKLCGDYIMLYYIMILYHDMVWYGILYFDILYYTRCHLTPAK